MKTIGVLGAGQLGRMLALAGMPLEKRFKFFDTTGSPSVGLEPVFIDPKADLNGAALKTFLESCDVVTYEFEHLPLELVQHIEASHALHPCARSIEICQDRAKEKALFKKLSIPTTEYRIVNSEKELNDAITSLGHPAVVKTTTEGYDGKGQFVIKDPSQCAEAWQTIGNRTLIVEEFINFKRELSVIAVRSSKDEVKVYPLAANQHHEGILRYSVAPAPDLDASIEKQAQLYMKELMTEMKHVGVLTLELFETDEGLVANEMAPRVHNSGHWSMSGAPCSQFENHVRAISGLPLGDTDALQLSCMINIIAHKGNVEAILELPYTDLHLYDKEERAGRKLGHVNVTADSYEELKWRTENVIQFLPDSPAFEPHE